MPAQAEINAPDGAKSKSERLMPAENLQQPIGKATRQGKRKEAQKEMNEHGIGYYLIFFLIGLTPGLIISAIIWINYLIWKWRRKRKLKREYEELKKKWAEEDRIIDEQMAMYQRFLDSLPEPKSNSKP